MARYFTMAHRFNAFMINQEPEPDYEEKYADDSPEPVIRLRGNCRQTNPMGP